MKLAGENLVKVYSSRPVVNELGIEVESEEIVGLLGPNGAGKTTTFYMLVGLIKPNGGRVFLNNEDITKLPMYKRAKRGIGYLPQKNSVFRKLTVKDNLLSILEMVDISESRREERLTELIEDLRLQKILNQQAITLSGGERRRVEIARALAIDPDFMLLDEPFSGVDPIVVGEIQNILFYLKEKGIGILVTDHNVREVLSIVDRAYLVYEGKILINGPSDFLLSSQKAKEIYLGEKFRMS